jgi:hypothetical protein
MLLAIDLTAAAIVSGANSFTKRFLSISMYLAKEH